MSEPYRRRRGVIYRPGKVGDPDAPLRYTILTNDGGEDAPLTRRGRWMFRGSVLALVVVGLLLIAASVHH